MGLELWMVFEALSTDKKGLEESVSDHIEKLRSEPAVEVTEVEVDEIAEVDDPHPQLDHGFSQVAEVRAEVDSFTEAVNLTLNYGPTYIQIEGPENFDLTMKDAQNALQNVATTMHQYAQQGTGGVLISKASEENT